MPVRSFDDAFDRLLGFEGGYVDHPSDPGGATRWGITERVARAGGYAGPMQDLPRDFAKAVYRNQYWNVVHADELPFALAFQLFDAAVNHGPAQAVKWLQGAVGAAQDGIVGPKTIAAVRNRRGDELAFRFNAQRLAFYASLSTWPTFGRGWTRRVAQNLTYAAGDL